MDVRVDNFLDFCKIFYPSRYRLEMKKPGFDFSLLEAEVRENGGIDVNNIFFNGFCVEETDKLDFDNFDIEKQLAKLDNDLDKAKYLTDCLYIIFSLPPLPFLPEKDLSVTPYYTMDEIFYTFKDNKIFGINVFDAIVFVFNELDKNRNDNAPFKLYLMETNLINFINDLYWFKEIKTNNNEIILKEFSNYRFFYNTFLFCIHNNFFDYLTGQFEPNQVKNISFASKEENVKKMQFYHFNKFNYELFKKNKFYTAYDFFIRNIDSFVQGKYDNKNLSILINFKTINNLNEYTIKLPFFIDKEIRGKTLYFPTSLTSNINTKINFNLYNKSEKVKVKTIFDTEKTLKNKSLSSTVYFVDESPKTILKEIELREDFSINFSENIPETVYLNYYFTFYSMNTYLLLNKEDLIDKDISNFGPRYANKIRKYLVKNSNNSIVNPISDENAGIPNDVT